MKNFFSKEYVGEPFTLFSTDHISAMITILILIALLILFSKTIKKNIPSRIIGSLLMFLLIFTEITLHIWLIKTDTWSIKYSLPIHLSSISLLLSAFNLWFKSFFIFEFTYFAGIGSAVQAILTPDLHYYSFPHFRYLHFFLSHGGIILANLFLIIFNGFKPKISSIGKAFILLNIYAMIVFFINMQLGSNYLYINGKPSNPSILEIFGPWPWYIIPLEVFTIVTFFILYLPFKVLK